MPGKPERGEWESELGGDYLGRMREKGPRKGESELSFEIRLGGLARGRELIVEAMRKTGDVNNAFARLGIAQRNVALWIRRLGFERSELEAVKGDKVHRGLPTR
jgi:hypothetical protein